TLFIIPFSLFLAIIMQWLMQRTTISPDTIIAFSFSGSVALGVLIISSLDRYSLIEGILFGSIYANGPSEILRQSLLAIAVLAFLFWQIRPLTLATLSPTIAEVRRIHTRTLSLSFALLTALTITIAQPMLGALLLSALIVIPSAAAKLVSQSFRQHILLSLLIGLLVPPTGVVLSCKTNLPTAPSIVLLNILVLIFCHILPRLLQLFKNKHHPSFPLYTQ
ncbi:MAG: metal ABC transporter permease, partial [Chthoniobacterales bacterium]|nr:metal ABC transporter permease [Chthoniobacterales bacterium]